MILISNLSANLIFSKILNMYMIVDITNEETNKLYAYFFLESLLLLVEVNKNVLSQTVCVGEVGLHYNWWWKPEILVLLIMWSRL